MRATLTVALAAMLTSGALAQSLSLGLKSPTIQRVSVEPGPGAGSVAAGGTLTLWADVTPRPNLHVYALGVKDFTPVSLSMTPRPGVAPAKPIYPPSELLMTVGVDTPVPTYVKTFRIRQPISVAKTVKPGETLTLTGLVTYQACDDQMCYPAASIPVTWTVAVK